MKKDQRKIYNKSKMESVQNEKTKWLLGKKSKKKAIDNCEEQTNKVN